MLSVRWLARARKDTIGTRWRNLRVGQKKKISWHRHEANIWRRKGAEKSANVTTAKNWQ